MNIEDCFKIGYVSKTHGLKGEVTIVLETIADWGNLESLFLDFNGNLVPYFVENISGKPNKPFVKFEGIDSLEKANSIKGSSLYAPKINREKLKRGEFYDDEIINFKVDDKNLGALGTVKEIQNQGANRLMVIIHGAKEILVPLNGPFIRSINKSKKLILLDLPDGYLEF